MKRGETVQTILEKFNTTKNDIQFLSVNEHYDGEFVMIKRSSEFLHTVKPLEDLNFIANKYNVEISHIMKCNDLKDKRLFIGQKLRF